jgi:preprotein translocase subunit SecG
MTTVISILLVLASLIVVVAILLQPAKAGASALGGSSQSVFGSTGGTTFLFRVTMWTAAFIMAACLFLGWYKIRNNKSSVIDGALVIPPVSAPATSGTVPAAPTAPATK